MRSNDFSEQRRPADRRRGRHHPERDFGRDFGLTSAASSASARLRRTWPPPRSTSWRTRRRRPRRRPPAPQRAAAARLPADPGDRRTVERQLEPQPRLDLPGPPAARGRRTHHVRARRGSQDRDADRRGHRVRRGQPRAARHAVGGRQGRSRPRPADFAHGLKGFINAWKQVAEAGTPEQREKATDRGRRRPKGHVPILADDES